MAAGDVLITSGSLTPSRNAFKFIATGDQAILIDAFAVARQVAADAAGTVTAWINVPDITGTYGIWSCGDTAAIEFISLRVEAGKLVAECNDATTDQWEHGSTNVVITPHKWHHVALVQNADLTPPVLYIDGERITEVTATLETDNGTWFLDCQLIDDGSIGADEEAGAAGQIDEFKGGISDVKYWPVELTDDNIREDYKGKPPAGINSNLTDWWPMVHDASNSVTAANNGTAGASILNVPEYSQFTSRYAFLGAIVADDISISIKDQEGHCTVIKAA